MRFSLRISAFILILLLLCPTLPVTANSAPASDEKTLTQTLSGKKISILGDSISTFLGITDNGRINSTITSEYLPRYAPKTNTDSSLVKLDSVNDTWWMLTINQYEMELLVNNSWRGTKVLDTGIRSGYGMRCENLHDDTLENNPDNSSIDPDIIAIYLGTNDYLQNVEKGIFDASTLAYVRQHPYEGFSYRNPETFAQAYTIMVHKILHRYPDAEIFCFTMSPVTYKTDVTELDNLNHVIRSVAEHYNLPVVDLYSDSGITWDNASHYLEDDKIHPNKEGLERISDCFNRALLRHCFDHTIVIDAAVAPTYMAHGLTEGKHCADCGKVLVKQDKISIWDHMLSNLFNQLPLRRKPIAPLS